MDPIGLVAAIFGVATQIVALVQTAQRSRDKCQILSEHVVSTKNFLIRLDEQWTPDPMTDRVLRSLKVALDDAFQLVQSSQRKKVFLMTLIRSAKKARKFDALDARISKILDQFHLANMVLIVNINKERFFMSVLEKLLQDGACRRLPKSDKEQVKSYIKNLTNHDITSPEARRVLEMITEDLRDHGDDLSVRLLKSHAGGGATTGGDALTIEVVSLTKLIVEEAAATRQNKEEVERLADLALQVADFMQHQQAFFLTQDPETEPLVEDLKAALGESPMIVCGASHQYYKSKFPLQVTCGGGGCGCGEGSGSGSGSMSSYSSMQAGQILKVVYKIEFYLQVLPVIAMRQMTTAY